MAPACAFTAACICRFSNDRVTARRAWRFGTTAPSQRRETGCGEAPSGTVPRLETGKSSTEWTRLGAWPVDNSALEAWARGSFRALGSPAEWCIAKCTLWTRLRMRRTRSKSTACTRRPICADPASTLTRARGSAGSDGQALAALGTTRVDDRAAPTGLHANEEAVRTGTTDFGGLIGAFHGRSASGFRGREARLAKRHCAARSGRENNARAGALSGKPMIRPKGQTPVNGPALKRSTNTRRTPMKTVDNPRPNGPRCLTIRGSERTSPQ